MKEQLAKRFGTFEGVFTPTIITILGVIMYLRQGWVVGNAGLFWAWVIIGISIAIAACTALSLSSIATNTRLHAGGAYAIISRSLGLEAGASIGIALYVAQSLAVTMYIFGFREGWIFLFPSHDPLVVDLLCFAMVFTIAAISTDFANRIQYFVMAITGLSLVSIALGDWSYDPSPIQWYGEFSATGGGYSGFWIAFAVFFPAVTGVMAGANMSGELTDPRRSIPRGTIWAVALSALIYFWMAWALAQMGSSADLIDNYNILIEKSAWSWVVELAILCATSSSALATLVGAPRIIHALASDESVPLSRFLKKRNTLGEPRNALFFTACIALIGLALRDLNAIAPVITICFLATYAFINGVVLVEQGLGLVSFRPRLKLPQWIPFFGAIGSLFAMVVINPSLSILFLSMLLLAYAILTRTRASVEYGDVRGNLFVAVAQWAAREAISLPQSEARAWLPHPMIPMLDGKPNPQSLELAVDLALPRGSIKLLRIGEDPTKEPQLDGLLNDIRQQGVFCTGTPVKIRDRAQGLVASLQALQGAFFRPNILMMSIEDDFTSRELDDIILAARSANMGLIFRSAFPDTLEDGGAINVWIRAQSPTWSIEIAQREGNLDLILLLAIRLAKRHRMRIRLLTTIHDEGEQMSASVYLNGLVELGRLPENTDCVTMNTNFWSGIKEAPPAKFQILGLPVPYNEDFAKKAIEGSSGSCLFVRSSGMESVLV